MRAAVTRADVREMVANNKGHGPAMRIPDIRTNVLRNVSVAGAQAQISAVLRLRPDPPQNAHNVRRNAHHLFRVIFRNLTLSIAGSPDMS